MPPASSRWPTAATPTNCSGSSRATGRSSRSTASTVPLAAPDASLGPFPRHPRPRFRRRSSRACAEREETWINAEIERAMLALHARRPCPFDRSAGTDGRAGRRALRRQARPRLLRREHVQPRDRRLEGRAGLAGRAAEGRRFHAARLPVHDRAPRLARRGQRSRARLMWRCSRRRSAAASAVAGGGRRGGRGAAACRRVRPISARSTGCSRRPAPPAPAGPPG